MPAHPKVGMRYRQEYYKGHAEDRAKIVSLRERVKVPLRRYRQHADDARDQPARAGRARGEVLRPRRRQVLAVDLSGGRDREELIRAGARTSEAEPAADEQQREPAAGERHGDLALLLLGGEARAEVGVDRLELGGLRGLEEAAAGDARDLLQRLRVGRDRDRLGGAGERVGQLDLAARACRARSRRSGSSAPSPGGRRRAGACCPRCSCRRRAARSPPAGGGCRCRRSFGTGVRADSMPRRSASPIAVPPSATSRSSASFDRLALGRRRDGLLGVVGERDEPEPQLVGQLVGQRVAAPRRPRTAGRARRRWRASSPRRR